MTRSITGHGLPAPTFESINAAVLDMIPADQYRMVMEKNWGADADIAPDFLGFVDVYWHLAHMIPKHWAIVDIGCAYSPQAFLFAEFTGGFHAVDPGVRYRFTAPNTTHYHMNAGEFLAQHGRDFNLQETFAICSYCPLWGERTTQHIRDHFPNLFVYYPHGPTLALIPGKGRGA